MGKHRQSSRVQMATTMPSYLMIIRMQFSSSKVQFSSYVADKIRLCNRNAYTHDVANIFRCLSYSTVTTVIELSTYRSSPAFNAAVTAVPEASPTQLFYDIDVLCSMHQRWHWIRYQAKFLTCEISDFTPCTHAQSNILHTKCADKTNY